jgi:acetyl-CoA carboxylase biotin carboxyl carrier protein
MEDKDLKELRELVEFLKENEIAEFDLHRDDVQVRIKFASALQPQVIHSAPQQFAAPAPALPVAPAPVVALAQEPAEVLHEVKSPIVGTFYESSAPGVAAFVKVGDQVEVGQVLCIVEAMKLMNEIESDVAGEIVKQVAQNGQPVEYGQSLYSVRAR